jgi:hypothetical protein
VSNVLEVVGEPKLPEVKMHLIPPTAPAEGTVLSNELCLKGRSASFVRHVCIDIGNTPMAGQFRAGLHQSTGTAVLLADLITGRAPAIDPAPFAPGRRPGPPSGDSVQAYLARAATESA